ncbi:hypothetical protein DL98DRAFT_507450, partial [Cadophora sp. DSE1049]
NNTNLLTSFKVDFALANPLIEEDAQNLALEDSDDDSDIYIQEDDNNDLNELDRYFQEARANKLDLSLFGFKIKINTLYYL